MNGAARKALVPFALLLLVACAHRYPGVGSPPSTVPQEAFSALIHCTIAFGKTRVAASGACAVDPSVGARIELRDPLGATRLLLLIAPRQATLIAVESGRYYVWKDASSDVPWSASDLWAAFSGRLPETARRIRRTSSGAAVSARWRNADGRIRASFTASQSGPCPHATVFLKGPRSAALRISFSQGKSFDSESTLFEPPAGLETTRATPADILQDLLQ